MTFSNFKEIPMKTPLIIALPALAFLTACGGGGGH